MNTTHSSPPFQQHRLSSRAAQNRLVHAGVRGFTLVELIAVMVILGILAAVIVPRYLDLTGEANDATYRAALAEGQARVLQGYSIFMLRTGRNYNGTSADYTTLQAILDPENNDGTVDIGDFKITFSDGGANGVNILLKDDAGTQITWNTDVYDGTPGGVANATVRRPEDQ